MAVAFETAPRTRHVCTVSSCAAAGKEFRSDSLGKLIGSLPGVPAEVAGEIGQTTMLSRVESDCPERRGCAAQAILQRP